MNNVKILVALFAGVGAASLPTSAYAESEFVATAVTSPKTATAHLDFTVQIPSVLFLLVGEGPNPVPVPLIEMGPNPIISNLLFDVPAARVGVGSIAPTGGDRNGGTEVSARVISNDGVVTFDVSTAGNLTNGNPTTLGTIPWSDFDVNSVPDPVLPAVSTSLFQHPAVLGTSTQVLAPTSGSNITDRGALWQFTYRNQTVRAAGSYGGVLANNGRVTYTVSTP